MSNIYLIFGCEQYYPGGGFNDLLARGASLETVKEAYILHQLENLFAYGHISRHDSEWFEVLDGDTAEDVKGALFADDDVILNQWCKEAEARWRIDGSPRRDTAKYQPSAIPSIIKEAYDEQRLNLALNAHERWSKPAIINKGEGRKYEWRSLTDKDTP